MSILSEQEISSIIDDISTIVGDDVISTTINLLQSGSTVDTWSPTSQTIPSMWTISSVSSFKGSYGLNELEEMNRTRAGVNVEKSGALVEMGDVKFILMVNDTTGILSVDDMITESGSTFQAATTYTIRVIDKDPLNICYFIGCRAL